MMKKIAILGFGGTIAMVPNEQGSLAPAKSVSDLMAYVPQLSDMADIDVMQLENLDSTNVNPNHWVRLSNKVYEIASNYDGIIITHGTDTMSYTASALALSLGRGLSLPVVITGSQLPMADMGTDAKFNLENSVKVVLAAGNAGICEVMVVFSDKVLRGSRSIKTSEARFDAFDTPSIAELASINATGVVFNPHTLKFAPDVDPCLHNQFSGGVFTIDLTPGLDPNILSSLIKTGACQAMLFKSLGAGNVPALDEFSILPVIEEAVEANIPVLISTKFVGGRSLPQLYEPGKKALEAGAIATGDMTDVMSQVKLMWLIGQGVSSMDDLRAGILHDYVGEIS